MYEQHKQGENCKTCLFGKVQAWDHEAENKTHISLNIIEPFNMA